MEQIPFTRSNVERVFATELFVRDPREFVIRPSFLPPGGGPVSLADGVMVRKIDLRVRQEESHPGFLVPRVGGTCIGLDAVRAHHGTLTFNERPRGRSLNEASPSAIRLACRVSLSRPKA